MVYRSATVGDFGFQAWQCYQSSRWQILWCAARAAPNGRPNLRCKEFLQHAGLATDLFDITDLAGLSCVHGLSAVKHGCYKLGTACAGNCLPKHHRSATSNWPAAHDWQRGAVVGSCSLPPELSDSLTRLNIRPRSTLCSSFTRAPHQITMFVRTPSRASTKAALPMARHRFCVLS